MVVGDQVGGGDLAEDADLVSHVHQVGACGRLDLANPLERLPAHVLSLFHLVEGGRSLPDCGQSERAALFDGLLTRGGALPTPGPALTQLELSTRSPQTPAGVSGLVEKVDQGGPGSRRSGAVRANFSDHAVIPAESRSAPVATTGSPCMNTEFPFPDPNKGSY